MLADLDLQSLQQRRKELRPTFLFKVVKGLVRAIPASDYLVQKICIEATKLSDYVTTNTVSNYQLNNNKCFKTIRCDTDTNIHYFFPKTIAESNQLDDNIVTKKTVKTLRSAYIFHAHSIFVV